MAKSAAAAEVYEHCRDHILFQLHIWRQTLRAGFCTNTDVQLITAVIRVKRLDYAKLRSAYYKLASNG